jgi:hypothetical protein
MIEKEDIDRQTKKELKQRDEEHMEKLKNLLEHMIRAELRKNPSLWTPVEHNRKA